MPEFDEEPGAWRRLLQISTTTWLGERHGAEGILWTARADGSAPAVQVDLEAAVSCLPLLDRTYAEVCEELTAARDGWGLSTGGSVDALIPAALLEAALRSGSSYWLDKAARWLEVLTPSEQTFRWAVSIERSGETTQSTRHSARRARRRWSGG